MKSFVIDSRDGDRINAVCISVKIALVTMAGSIATSEDENGAFSISAFLDAIDDSLFDDITRTFHRSAIIWGSPAATVNRGVLISVIQGCCLVYVRDGP